MDEYLVYGWFRRFDRPSTSGDFLSKRWCTLEDLVEHAGAGVNEKIKAWEKGKVTRRDATFDATRQKRLRAESQERDEEEARGEGEGHGEGAREGEGEGEEGVRRDAEGMAAQ